MNFSSLSASERRLAILGGLVAIISVISFLDPSGSWGAVMILSLLGGLGALFVALQPQLAPTMKLPAPKGLSQLVLGALAAGGFAIAMLTYIGYIGRNIANIYVILMFVGLIAALVLLWTGWQAYRAETPAGTQPASPPSPAPSAPTPPAASAPPPPPPPPAAEG